MMECFVGHQSEGEGFFGGGGDAEVVGGKDLDVVGRRPEFRLRLGSIRANAAQKVGLNCDTVQVEHEQPYEAIIKTAKDKGCDAIVMASHGRSGISAVLLGSVTNKVLTHTAIPVLVVH